MGFAGDGDKQMHDQILVQGCSSHLSMMKAFGLRASENAFIDGWFSTGDSFVFRDL